MKTVIKVNFKVRRMLYPLGRDNMLTQITGENLVVDYGETVETVVLKFDGDPVPDEIINQSVDAIVPAAMETIYSRMDDVDQKVEYLGFTVEVMGDDSED